MKDDDEDRRREGKGMRRHDGVLVVGIVAWLSLARSLFGVTMQGSTPLTVAIGYLVRAACHSYRSKNRLPFVYDILDSHYCLISDHGLWLIRLVYK